MTNTLHTIFVYGSLRKGFNSEAFAYMNQYFTHLGLAKVKGLVYDLGEYPAAIPTEEEAFITGDLFVIKNPSAFSYAMAQLDDYEDVYPEQGPALYCRNTTTVYLPDGTQTQAWIYWYNQSIEGMPRIECGDLLQYASRQNP